MIIEDPDDFEEMFDDIEVVHIRGEDGLCRISLNGQGHLPCETHVP